jgi:hypothetical protein
MQDVCSLRETNSNNPDFLRQINVENHRPLNSQVADFITPLVKREGK